MSELTEKPAADDTRDTVPDHSPGIVVNMLLCDAAQVAAGKISLLGGGLAVVGPKPQPMAMAIHITVPWDKANVKHQWQLELMDEDGRPVTIRERPVVAQGQFEAGRPAGLRPGSPLPMALAMTFPPMALPGGRAFQFRFSVEGESKPEWVARFFTRAAQKPKPEPPE